MIVIADLAFTCRGLLGWDESKTFEMLAGLSYKSTEPAHRLADLARMARERPSIARLLEDVDETTAGRLNAADAGFAEAFYAYQRRYCCRSIGYDAAAPTMAEVPELTLNLIRHQVAQGYDPAAEAAEAERMRSRTVAEARAVLAGRPVEERERFERTLGSAQRAYPVREDNEFFTVSAPSAFGRYLLLEQGRRLAERGQIRERDDVFFLDFDDILALLRNGGNRHNLVCRRKGERLWALEHPGPPSYGTDPGPPPSFKAFPPEARFAHEALMWVMDRMGLPALEMSELNVKHGGTRVQGIPASGGRYTGPARVIMDESQFDKLQAGDVLVCPVTSPVWSVLFPSIGDLVTDSGGILSHPAIIAREYVIPAVVSAGNATQLLKDGQMVTVDGDAGQVDVAGE
jgi:pyruvate,water dikinase